MSMHKKAQLVEAVMFFGENLIQKALFFSEFEAVLDGVVNMPEFADQQVRAVYLLINPRLQIRSAVFFFLDFDELGKADTGWNMPLRHIAERAGRGPDLGAGPIRLACRSQCPVSWHQMHMWDPDLAPGHNELSLLRDAVKANRLGILAEEESSPVELDRLHMAREEKWHAPPAPEMEQARLQAEQEDQQQRLKTAQLIKQLRLRISSLTQQNDVEVAKLRLDAEQQRHEFNEQMHNLQHALQLQEELNLALKADLHGHATNLSNLREEMTSQLTSAADHAQATTELLRNQFEKELQAKISAAVLDYKAQLAARDDELVSSAARHTRLQQELEHLQAQHAQLLSQAGEQILQHLSELGVVFVVYHPGAGHLTIALQDIVRYQDRPMAYVAAKCFVSEEQYSSWLEHYQHASCTALLPSGERCAMPVDRVDTPGRFVVGESNCCARHKSSKRAQTPA